VPPDLSPHLQAFVRTAYGCLLLLTLAWALPHWRRFFLSERWGGYAESKRSVDLVQNPIVMPILLAIWFASAGALTVGRWTLLASLVNLVVCRYFFVAMRWNGVLRGMGAPGLITYWLAAAVFLLEYTQQAAPHLRSLALLVVQVDLAFIIGSAGLYKLSAGYAVNDGMDLGLVNPQWGYWWRFYQRIRPTHWIFKAMNHAAWSTELVAAVLMLVPHAAWRAAGGMLIIASFAFVCTQIRLAWLGEMMMLCGLLFVPPGHVVDRLIAAVMPASRAVVVLAPNPLLNDALEVFLIAYLALLPLAYGGLFYNFYGRRRLPVILQGLLERYTNSFGIMIWRVFSVDHLNFFVRIHEEHGARWRLLSRYGSAHALRYCHVAESIAITTVFTTLKYYASNPRIFEERLVRYARTVPVEPQAKLVFEYVTIQKVEARFEHVPAVTYTVSPEDWSIAVRTLVESFSVHAAHQGSPVHEGQAPGSYAPAAR
jgi:hypothetical protein